jgi:hypothetical protein
VQVGAQRVDYLKQLGHDAICDCDRDGVDAFRHFTTLVLRVRALSGDDCSQPVPIELQRHLGLMALLGMRATMRVYG